MKDSVEKEASTWYTDHHGRLELGPTGRSGNGIKYAQILKGITVARNEPQNKILFCEVSSPWLSESCKIVFSMPLR